MKTIKYVEKLQEYCKNNDEVMDTLAETFNLRVKKYSDRYVINYGLIPNPDTKFHPIVKECRGLILSKNFDIMCRSFTRFFNLGEDDTVVYDFNNWEWMDKLDGSLINLYWDFLNNQWTWATRGTAYAEGYANDNSTFMDLIFKSIPFEFEMDNLNKEYTYMLELTTPENRIVTKYNKYSLTLLDCRHKLSGNYSPEELLQASQCLRIPIVKRQTFSSVEELRSKIDRLDKYDEGFVGINKKTGVRIKVKNPEYLILHRLRGEGLNHKRCSTFVLGGDYKSYLKEFPEDENILLPYIKFKEKLVKRIRFVLEKCQNLEKKEFALLVKDTPEAGILFAVRNGKAKSICDAINKLTDNAKIRLATQYLGEKND